MHGCGSASNWKDQMLLKNVEFDCILSQILNDLESDHAPIITAKIISKIERSAFTRSMQIWSLDTHPILGDFRGLIGDVVPPADSYFHLFLPPPYAPQKGRTPWDYFFISSHSRPSNLVRYHDRSFSMTLRESSIVSDPTYRPEFNCRILVTSPCSSGILQFVIYEIDNDFYDMVTVPRLSAEIAQSAGDATKAETFLYQTLGNADVKKKLDDVKSMLFKVGHGEAERDKLLDDIRDSIEQVSNVVFSIPEIQSLPVGVKRSLNLLIFNAISARAHFLLLMAFNKEYETQNKIAQASSRNFQNSTTIKLDMAKMDQAVAELHGILHRPNPVDIIDHFVLFFDAMVAALPGVEVAADDILPAICVAMTRDIGFGSHVVSLFNYLTEIWPATGMDDRVTYILVTCSIAAQHLATKPTTPERAKPAVAQDPAMCQRTVETIGLLEDLLNDL
jgi:hypothetical protein